MNLGHLEKVLVIQRGPFNLKIPGSFLDTYITMNHDQESNAAIELQTRSSISSHHGGQQRQLPSQAAVILGIGIVCIFI
jgi:hypothetical protein